MNSYRTENYIKDKVIVITGASSGFGKETAKKAAELGGKVVLAARREELLREITQEIRESGGEASYIKTDVRVKDQVNAMAKFAVDTYGRIDVLVNDAGTMPLAYYSEHAIAMLILESKLSNLYSRMSVPPSLMHPSSTSQKRVIKLHNVVLPEPDGPTIAVVVFAGIVRLTWFKIW